METIGDKYNTRTNSNVIGVVSKLISWLCGIRDSVVWMTNMVSCMGRCLSLNFGILQGLYFKVYLLVPLWNGNNPVEWITALYTFSVHKVEYIFIYKIEYLFNMPAFLSESYAWASE